MIVNVEITVFTPTYNRAYIINRLYESLQRQEIHNFEWLVVDDGSVDETEELFRTWMNNESKFPIRYYKKKNGGKCRAINFALDLAKGKLFFVVDSDDYLTDDALKKIIAWEKSLPKDEKYCGVAGNLGMSSNFTPNTLFETDYYDGTLLDRYRNIDGERALAFFTEIHKKYRYPEYSGEKFMTEAVIYNRMAMPKLAEKNQCTGCTACVSICPRNCIQMKKDNAGFEFPVIMERSACIACGACERVCPVLMKKKDDENLSTSAYAAFSNNNALRLESSSGGIFSELAATILQRGGVIYGASYDDEGVVRHIEIKEQTELGKLQGAKYSQSILGDCFLSIKKQLDSGRIVLFSGTPCQVAGLKAFLKRDYENLVCIDFVCHGVPSPMVWEKYVKYRSLTDNSDSFPQHINLRNKESGWSHYAYSVKFAYADKKRYLCKNGDDPFMQLFVKDYILRESCSSCHFKGYHRVSDITLGDFWGIWNINPKMDDNKGTSLILTHTAKGEKMMNAVSENIKCEQVYLEQAARENPSLLRSSVHKQNRDIVLKTIESENFQEILPLLQVKQPQRRSKKEIIKRVLKKLCGLG